MEARKERNEQKEKEEQQELQKMGRKNQSKTRSSIDPVTKDLICESITGAANTSSTTIGGGGQENKGHSVEVVEDVLVFSRSVHKMDSSLE